MLRQTCSQLNKIEAGTVRGVEYCLSKSIQSTSKDQCPELENILKLFPTKFLFLCEKIIDLCDTSVEFPIVIVGH